MKKLFAKCLVVPPLDANCYIAGCARTRLAAVIDPGGAADRILDALAAAQATVTAILLTHGHFDHMTAAAEVAEACGASVCAHPADASMLAHPNQQMPELLDSSIAGVQVLRPVGEADEIEIGKLRITVLETPGHSPGSVCYVTEGAVFTGDTLFADGVGRTDLPGGDFEQLRTSLRQKLLALPDDMKLYPGHGPASTLGEERRTNPWLLEL